MATHILFIEPDEASTTDFEENIAMFMDAQVTIAHSAEEAVSQLETGVRPDVTLLAWDKDDNRGPNLVHSLRDIAPTLPIALVVEEGEPSPSETVALYTQAVLSKPFRYPELRGQLIEAIQQVAGTRPLPGNPESIGMTNTAPLSDEPSNSPELQQHISLTNSQTESLISQLQQLEQNQDGPPMLLSQDGALIVTSSAITDDTATTLAKLAGRIWREGATHPTPEWLRFDDQLPGSDGERRNIALYSVHVAGDLTLSVGWDGSTELSEMRSIARQTARELAAIL